MLAWFKTKDNGKKVLVQILKDLSRGYGPEYQVRVLNTNEITTIGHNGKNQSFWIYSRKNVQRKIQKN